VQSLGVTGLPQPAPPTPPTWYASFRYYRLAQNTDDLFDAYRNMYLALESILDSIASQGRESEGDWLRRALAAVGGIVNLADFAPLGSSNPSQDIYNDLYVGTRSALFHAKGSRPFLLPQDAAQRAGVLASLDRLGRLYCALAKKRLGINPGVGLMTIEGFRAMSKAWEPDFRIYVTDDTAPLDAASTGLNPGGGLVQALSTRPEPALDGPLLKSFIGAVPGKDLAGLARVSRLVPSFDGKIPLAYLTIDGELTVAGVGRFEAHVGVRLRNSRLPKTLYST